MMHGDDLTNNVMMSNSKAPFSPKIHQTADGSPTLSINDGEKMHSLEGALSESLYIYLPCVEIADKVCQPVRILSMGLGLAYNEILSLAHLLSLSRQDFYLASFEKVSDLKNQFINWLQEDPADLSSIYDDILARVAEHFSLNQMKLKNFIFEAYKDQRLELFDELPSENPCGQFFHAILYDAFSGGTDKNLWSPDHLNWFISQFCDPQYCVLSTYAATGDLKRTLKSQGFYLQKKKGFGMKRQSTFAVRDLS